MMGRTHLMGGFASLWLLRLVPGASDAGSMGLLAILAALGALLPDLDARDSKLQRLTVGGIAPFALPAFVLHRALGHRGLLHSALGLALVGLSAGLPLVWFAGWQAACALLLGYASHLLLDACTPSGVPLRFPDRRRWHLLPAWIRPVTGSAEEEVVFALLAVLSLSLLLSTLSPDHPAAVFLW